MTMFKGHPDPSRALAPSRWRPVPSTQWYFIGSMCNSYLDGLRAQESRMFGPHAVVSVITNALLVGSASAAPVCSCACTSACSLACISSRTSAAGSAAAAVVAIYCGC